MVQELAQGEWNDFKKAGVEPPPLVAKLAKAGDWGRNQNVARDVQTVLNSLSDFDEVVPELYGYVATHGSLR